MFSMAILGAAVVNKLPGQLHLANTVMTLRISVQCFTTGTSISGPRPGLTEQCLLDSPTEIELSIMIPPSIRTLYGPLEHRSLAL